MGLMKKVDRMILTWKELRHQHVIGFVGHYEDTVFDEKCVVMELASGGSLADLIETKPLPTQAAKWLLEVASALEYIHGKGVVHADIRPENLLISPQGMVKLANFDLAMEVAEPASLCPLTFVATDSQLTESPGNSSRDAPPLSVYFSPERVQATSPTDYGLPDDIWALGVVLLELMSGTRISEPFGDSDATADGYIASVTEKWNPMGKIARGMLMTEARHRLKAKHVHSELKNLVKEVCLATHMLYLCL
jgi:serine/threonine protein kinase